MNFKKEITKLIAKETKLGEEEVEKILEIPPEGLGDYALPCFTLAKILKKNPVEIAKEIESKIKDDKLIEKTECKGAYLNIFLNKSILTKNVIETILKEKDGYGSGEKKKERIVIEYPAPNTNKPLHLGHVRNMLLGQAIANILKFLGYAVFSVNLNNDRGVHICKAILAYERWGDGKEPDRKSDHFVGDFYVLYQKKLEKHPELEQEIQIMLQKWEAGDKKTIQLWKKMNMWALSGFDETYKKFNINFDKVYNESEHYKKSKDIVIEAYNKGIFKKDKNENIIAQLEEYGLPNKVLLRANGTTVYMTQDINLAELKYKDFKMDRSIYTVGSEQILHFKQLFKILELLKFKNTQGLYHLAYGMVYLPEGKMKSREGKVVDADDLVEEIKKLVVEEVKKRYNDIDDNEIEKRAKSISMGAIRFFILRYDPLKDFTFHPEESISFEGETGPYVQYGHARICSIMRKYGRKIMNKSIDFKLLSHPIEIELIKLLSQFPETVEKAGESYKPCLLTRYLFDLARCFNEYYHQCPVLNAEPRIKEARLVLITAIQQVLKNGLKLIEMGAPERM